MRALLLSFVVLLCGVGSEAWALRLRTVDIQEKDGRTEVLLRLDTSPERVEPLLLPERRLVLDLPGATNLLGSARLPGRGPCLTAVRIGEHPGFTRVVLDLAADCTYRIQREERSIRVQLGERDGESSAPAPFHTTADEASLQRENRPRPEGAVPFAGRSTPRAARGVLLPASELVPSDRSPNGVERALPATTPAIVGAAASRRSPGGATGDGPPATAMATPEVRPTPSPFSLVAPGADPPEAAPQDSTDRDEARVSIEFDDVDVRTALDLLARAGGREVIFRPEVEGRVRVKAVDRRWREVFEQVLRGARLEAVEHDGLLLVSPAAR